MGETFLFRGHDIPVDLLRLTGGGPESFAVISDKHIELLKTAVGLEPNHTVMEIGCGIGRDAIPLTDILGPTGRYIGIDIIGRSIDWCQGSITAKHPNFVFHHFDIGDQLHNPAGVAATPDFTLPMESGSVDRIILWSVFTHMFTPDIIHYLKEFARVLKPDGCVWATCFIVNDDILTAARRTNLTPFDLRFEHPHGDGCFINDPVHPAGAVAFSEAHMMQMIAQSGLTLAAPMIFGSWSGHFPIPPLDPGQDSVILKRAS